MLDKRYIPTALVVYLSYFMHGMAVIMISQHRDFFEAQWSGSLEVNKAGVAFAIAAIGYGKLVSQFLGGWASDRFGRKPSLIVGMGMYIIFFAGLAVAPNWIVAACLAVLFGVANSIVDGGTYPTLMEVFPKYAGSANVALKAFIAAAQAVLPFFMGVIISSSLPWNLALICAAIAMTVLFVLVIFMPFPDYRAIAAQEAEAKAQAEAAAAERAVPVPVSKFTIEGLAIIAMGFTTLGSFWLAQQELPVWGKELAGMNETASLTLTSTYATGSLISVFVTALLVAKWVRPVYFMIIGTAGTVLGYLLMMLIHSPSVYHLGAFLIGFFASGGLLQLLIIVMAQFFPGGKGKITGIVFTAGSLATALLPTAVGLLSGNPTAVLGMGLGVATVGLVLGVIVNIRHRMVVVPVERLEAQSA